MPLLPLIFKSRVVKSLLRQNELKILLARKIKKKILYALKDSVYTKSYLDALELSTNAFYASKPR